MLKHGGRSNDHVADGIGSVLVLPVIILPVAQLQDDDTALLSFNQPLK